MVEVCNAKLRGARGESPEWRLLCHLEGVCSGVVMNMRHEYVLDFVQIAGPMLIRWGPWRLNWSYWDWMWFPGTWASPIRTSESLWVRSHGYDGSDTPRSGIRAWECCSSDSKRRGWRRMNLSHRKSSTSRSYSIYIGPIPVWQGMRGSHDPCGRTEHSLNNKSMNCCNDPLGSCICS